LTCGSENTRYSGTRTQLNIDLYNALNASTILAQSNAFANWQTPQRISRLGS
jgi:hypothetical protein